MRTVNLYRITTTQADAYASDRWSTTPATNEVHPETGLEYDEVADGGPVAFELPEGVAYDDEACMLYDEREGRYLELLEKRGEPYVLVYRKAKGVTNTGNVVDETRLFEVTLRRA